MKKLLLLFALATMVMATKCKEDPKPPTDNGNNPGPTPDGYENIVVTSQQEALVGDFTGTWCPPCGSWGHAAVAEGVALAPDHVNALAVHETTSDKFYNPTAVAFQKAFVPTFYASNGSSTGWPSFFEGTTNYEQGTTAWKSTIVDLVSSNSALAGIGMEKSLTDRTLTMKVKSKFFRETTGEYNLVLLLVENNVIGEQATQQGVNKAYNHKHVLRNTILGTVRGETLATGSIAANTEYKATYTYTIPATVNPDNAKVYAVIVKMNGGNIESIVNSNSF